MVCGSICTRCTFFEFDALLHPVGAIGYDLLVVSVVLGTVVVEVLFCRARRAHLLFSYVTLVPSGYIYC